jgi:hypothetical protein
MALTDFAINNASPDRDNSQPSVIRKAKYVAVFLHTD